MDLAGFMDRDGEVAHGVAADALAYDRASIRPGIVHFGTGQRFRATVAPLVDRVLAIGHWDCGIIAVSQSGGRVHAALKAADGCFMLTECDGLRRTGSQIRSILKVLDARRDHGEIIASIADPRIFLVTVTVSEAALSAAEKQPAGVTDAAGDTVDACEEEATPVAQLVAGLAARCASGQGGLTIMACDNGVGSNLRLASLIDAYAVARDIQLADWIAINCRFPAVYADRLLVGSVADRDDVTAVATEPFVHWVIEDNLGSERGALEDAGVSLVLDVAPFLVMRQRLLDGGLLLLGCVGLLRGHQTLDQAYAEPELAALLDAYYAEAADALPPITGFDLDRYVAQIKPRMANPAMRLPLGVCAHEGSRRLGQGPLATIVALQREGRSAEIAAALVAAWMIHCTSPDLNDSHAESLWSRAARAGDDWPALVATLSDYAPIFGSVGQKPIFRDLITRSVRHIPGLESLVDG